MCIRDRDIIKFKEEESYVPVFINEAAYMEKNIAMSFTKREIWHFEDNWKDLCLNLFLSSKFFRSSKQLHLEILVHIFCVEHLLKALFPQAYARQSAIW